MQPAQLLITFVDGKMGLQTNVTDKVILLGLLEMAKAVALQQSAGPPPSPVQTPTPALARHLLAGSGANGR